MEFHTIVSLHGLRSGGGVACSIDDAAKVHCAAHWPGVAEDQARMLQVPKAEVEVMRWVEIPDVRATAVAVGESHVCVVDLDSVVVCWGDERLRRLDIPIDLRDASDACDLIDSVHATAPLDLSVPVPAFDRLQRRRRLDRTKLDGRR